MPESCSLSGFFWSIAPRRALFFWIVLLALTGCARKAEPASCPAGFAADEARARRTEERLRATSEGARLLERARGRETLVCFGPTDVSAITTTGMILLDARPGEAEIAARLGHLLLHAVDGLPMAEPIKASDARDCYARVREALALEARAFALELRLRRELGVGAGEEPRTVPYEFEEPFWQAEPEAREPLVLRYLEEHPHGGPGVDAIAAGYASRCAEERAP